MCIRGLGAIYNTFLTSKPAGHNCEDFFKGGDRLCIVKWKQHKIFSLGSGTRTSTQPGASSITSVIWESRIASIHRSLGLDLGVIMIVIIITTIAQECFFCTTNTNVFSSVSQRNWAAPLNCFRGNTHLKEAGKASSVYAYLAFEVLFFSVLELFCVA